ncbi:Transcriptional regulator, contains HTH domain [Natranaeroarchaeum sulfidigenes]|uniref:Transcriptional regulator, contains HTH domain n=1 Tax=Natranaeroarchaeum sulfidigenes TaxID=2784880 RepID=A0A897MR15_9EURY|nr:MarR family transcriptional regulator [Natranaeroarchaeum sulfidigenes]QSG02862.1 Transcriptional regulator, contains HTH domain [Natranaeroarchaeum sulfidigenes]
MSIDRDTFENTSENELADLSVPDQVLGFLVANQDRAFKAREIASHLSVDEGAVSTALSRLKDRSLIEHKATYWAVTDDAERLDRYSGYERTTALFNDQLGAEEKESWREHAPQKPHRASRTNSDRRRDTDLRAR